MSRMKHDFPGPVGGFLANKINIGTKSKKSAEKYRFHAP